MFRCLAVSVYKHSYSMAISITLFVKKTVCSQLWNRMYGVLFAMDIERTFG